ncbi:DDE-type integrase/transposase/recombinase [Peribacillus sp. JNUCC 23]
MPVAQNILNQQFNADKPQSVWVPDITYIPTSKGWVYLASVMDLYSRKIIGWAADKQMAKGLTLLALT